MTWYTRRDCGRLALASLPFGRAFAKLDSRVNGVLIGAQSYSFRDRPLDAAIQAFVDVGLSSCELSMGHVEPAFPRVADSRAALRDWRLTVPLDNIRAIRRKFDQAGIDLSGYAYNMRDDFTDEEIARGFEFARALGVPCITTSATVSVTPRIAAQAGKYKMMVGMHGHSNIKDPNEYAKPETFVAAIREVLQLLKRRKYPIPANIEYEYDGGDPVAEVRRCYEYCRRALA